MARPKLTPQKARAAAARALARTGRTWLPGPPQLVFYPFAPTNSPRKPYLPLAQLPPLLQRGWTPSGVDLLPWSGAASAGIQLQGAVQVPVSLPLSAELPVVHYPFYRVPLAQDGRDSVVWCDASSGQVILPDALTAEEHEPASVLVRIGAGLFATGAALGLFLPFPISVIVLAAAGGAAWWLVAQR